MSVYERMQSILEEAEMGAEGAELDMKAALPQLVLAMDAMGLDPKSEDDQAKFFALLKKMVSSKASLMKAMRTFSAGKARTAVKAARSTL